MNILDNTFQTILLSCSLVILVFFTITTIILFVFTLILRAKFIRHFKSQYRGY